jgi:hypothetical protein
MYIDALLFCATKSKLDFPLACHTQYCKELCGCQIVPYAVFLTDFRSLTLGRFVPTHQAAGSDRPAVYCGKLRAAGDLDSVPDSIRHFLL